MTQPTAFDRMERVAPLFSRRGAMIACLVSLVVLWPIYVTGAVFTFVDTIGYINAGAAIWSLFGEAVGWHSEVFLDPVLSDAPSSEVATGLGQGASLEADGDGTPRFGRSLFYSPVAFAAVELAGPIGLAFLQTTIAIFAFFVLIDPSALRSKHLLVFGAILTATLTSLPWFAVYLMPDILGAVPVIFGAALAGPFNKLERRQQVVLTLIAIFAAGAHYGNVPLTIGICLGIVAVLALSRGLTLSVVLAAALASSVPPTVNIASSWIFLDEPSAAPLRLPILLARSIQDGPGALYLKDVCPEAKFAMCDAFGDNIPESISEFLWQDDGVRSLDAETVQQIRNEEIALVAHIFAEYPVEQSYAFLRNIFRQLMRAGTDAIRAQPSLMLSTSGEGDPDVVVPLARTLLRIFDTLAPAVTLVSALMLAALVLSGRLRNDQKIVLAAVVYGVVLNAAIFGGLSAPVDRYQSRLIWILPALLVLIVAGLAADRRSAASHDQRDGNDAS